MMEDLTGKQFGQYQIIAPLGMSGAAAVFKAYQPTMNRYIALKVLPLKYIDDPNYLNRFRQEATVIANLEHPNIHPVYDSGEAEGYTYLVMRYVEGGTLSELLFGQPMPLDQVRDVVAQVGKALDYAHSHGVVHGDVNPNNILVDQNGRYLLTNFGIAKMVESTSESTMTASFIDSPQYASPEQGLGQELDGRSDIYSLGVILYEMVTGKRPFDGDTPMAVVFKHVHEALPSPRSLNPALSEQVEKVINKALAKDLSDRYTQASELVGALDTAISGTASTLQASPLTEDQATLLGSSPVLRETPIPDQQTLPAVGMETQRDVHPTRSRRIPGWLWAVGGILILIVVGGVVAVNAGLLNRFGWNFTRQGALTAVPTENILVLAPTESPTDVPSPTATKVPPTPIPPIGSDNIYVEYILDASGSMLETMQGKTKLLIAQDVLSERVTVLPPDVHVGLRVYGHRLPYQQEAESCQDIELTVPIVVGGGEQIIAWLPTMQAQGMTPMSESIRLASEDFIYEPERKNTIILISDGIETCGDDPSDVVRYLQGLGIKFTVHVIGLGVDGRARDQLSQLADTAGGIYHDANSEQDLREALNDLNTVAVQPPDQGPLVQLSTPEQINSGTQLYWMEPNELDPDSCTANPKSAQYMERVNTFSSDDDTVTYYGREYKQTDPHRYETINEEGTPLALIYHEMGFVLEVYTPGDDTTDTSPCVTYAFNLADDSDAATETVIAQTETPQQPTDTPQPPTPTIQISPTSDVPTLYIDKDMWCRNGPSKNYEEVWSFVAGTTVKIMATNGDGWWFVERPEDPRPSRYCWVGGGVPNGDISIVPIKTGPPPRSLSPVTVKKNTITISVRDAMQVDGDRISVSVNGRIVVSDYTLTGGYYEINVQLVSGNNTITFTALGTGSSGPNTLEVRISNVSAGQQVQVSQDLNTGESANLIITAP